MLVTEGTGHVGNTFVEIKNNYLACKKKSDFTVGAVGMWEARVVCELSKAVRKERESAFLFLSFLAAGIPIALHSFFSGSGCKINLWLSNRVSGKLAK